MSPGGPFPVERPAPSFARGCVVTRGGHWGVVWAARGQHLDVFPIIVPHPRHVNDVLLELSDLVACGAAPAYSAIRPTILSVSAAGQTISGTLPGATWCRLVAALVREAQTTATAERWAGDREHRREARTRPVNLVSA